MFGALLSGRMFSPFTLRSVQRALAVLAGVMVMAFIGCSSGTSEDAGGGSPNISSFSASPATIGRGQSSTLSWSVSNASSTSIDNSVGTVTGTSTVVSPQNTTTFTLTATNAKGSSTSAATVVVVPPPVIASFTATPASVPSGGTSTLAWSISGATGASIDHSVGTVALTGSTTVSPSATTTYTLTATNSSGGATTTATGTATVTLTAPVADSATGAVNTNASGVIATPLGAKITVPLYAVPPTNSNGTGTGTMTFSLEKIAASTPTLPPGESVTTDVYRLGPEGFTMARPVMVTLPVSGDRQSNLVHLYRVDPTTNQAVLIPSTYNPAAHTVSGPALKFSPWFATYGTVDNTADGAFMVTNASSNYWLKLCVDQINSVTYPAQAPSVAGSWGGQAMWAPMGEIGWNNSGRWFLVQGTYRVCAEMATSGTFLTPPGQPVHWFLDNMRITGPSTYANGWLTSGDISYSAPPGGAITGPCPCQPTFTPSAGTGDVQVTLTWGLAAPGVDLDLHVIEPSGEEIYYNHLTSATGGSLDRDNKCSNYIDGKPENIYWPTGAAPHGSYQVKVVWYGDCSSGHAAQTYSVRIINKGSTTSFSGSCSPNATVNVTTFTVN